MWLDIARGADIAGHPSDRAVLVTIVGWPWAGRGRGASVSASWSPLHQRRLALRAGRGWADAYVELRLGRLVLAVTWDL